MAGYRSDFLSILNERGFIHQCSDFEGVDTLAAQGELTTYVGYDCTASSLHVGHLLSIMMLHWLQQTGNKPITLMGGGTTRVGDPSGRDETRKILTVDDIENNKTSIRQTFTRFLSFGEGKPDAEMADNAEWLVPLNYIEFLRDVGKHFSVNRMLTMDSVKLRLAREEASLSFLEFNYMILQAYDFLELNRRHGCTLQMGGSDQWGNIVTGIDLARRVDQVQLHALTTPLLTSASGQKMGKTAAGAVWLNPDMLSPYEFWQYWRNVEDADVGRFLRRFTELPMAEISKLEALAGVEINEAKKVLATEITRLAHGDEAATNAANTAAEAFEHGRAAAGLPTVDISADTLAVGIGLLDALRLVGLATSNSEARRHVQGKAVRVNDEQVGDPSLNIDAHHVVDGVIKLSVGRKRHALLKPA
jgi:tyrosyl-tRNA synthetase